MKKILIIRWTINNPIWLFVALKIYTFECVISMKLNIGKNLTGLEMMTPMNQMFPNL